MPVQEPSAFLVIFARLSALAESSREISTPVISPVPPLVAMVRVDPAQDLYTKLIVTFASVVDGAVVALDDPSLDAADEESSLEDFELDPPHAASAPVASTVAMKRARILRLVMGNRFRGV